MSSPDTPTTAGTGLSKTLLVTGGVLWLLAAAAVFGTLYLARQREASRSELARQGDASQPQMPVIDIEAERAAAASGGRVADESERSESTKSGSPTAAAWDPEGIQDFELVDMHGKPVTKNDLLGKPWAVCFTFTRCTYTCPRIMGAMYQLQSDLKDVDVRLVTVTVDPKHDTPEVLRRQAETFAADPEKWWFLTGHQTDIYMLIWKSFKLPVKEMLGEDRKPGFEVLHSNKIMLVDAEGRVVGGYNGTIDAEVDRLRRALIAEAEKTAAPSENADAPDDADSAAPSETEDAAPATAAEDR